LIFLFFEGEKADVIVALVEGGEVVAKRGFKVTTVKPRVVGRFCVAYGPGLYCPQAGANKFTVRVRNKCGTSYNSGGIDFEVVIKCSKQSTAAAQVVIQDHEDGLYVFCVLYCSFFDFFYYSKGTL
jgi:hypothetical protein